jgi:hypothetical protein
MSDLADLLRTTPVFRSLSPLDRETVAQAASIRRYSKANAGLSAADTQQLAKPGAAAIVAVGHDGSVFIASAGPRLNRDLFEVRQYALAQAEVRKRLRGEWASGRVSVAVSDAHFSHLVTLALAKANIVQYWFSLRGTGRESYEGARIVFSQVVVGAAAQLKRKG